ncbi:unnamed protein product, partial [Effrenium voratum]
VQDELSACVGLHSWCSGCAVTRVQLRRLFRVGPKCEVEEPRAAVTEDERQSVRDFGRQLVNPCPYRRRGQTRRKPRRRNWSGCCKRTPACVAEGAGASAEALRALDALLKGRRHARARSITQPA